MFYMLPQPPHRMLRQPLTALSARLGDWSAVRESPITPEVASVLKADDTLNRDYVDAARGASANLFIAYFGSQQQGRAPHSPQHCMPGAGWEPQVLMQVPVPVQSAAASVRINRFILAKGQDQIVVHYWYESNKRVLASEYLAKIYLVLDSIRYRRSDTSLVRVTVPVPNGRARDAAIADGMRFVQACFDPVRAILE
jgi:EpsI family protein